MVVLGFRHFVGNFLSVNTLLIMQSGQTFEMVLFEAMLRLQACCYDEATQVLSFYI